MSWQNTVIRRLTSGANPNGGWGYRPNATTCSEPTALACLALASHGVESAHQARALDVLGELQRSDGGVPVSAQVTSPCWTTSMAILAWTLADSTTGRNHQTQVDEAAQWLFAIRGRRLPRMKDSFGHDRTLQAWPWVEGTHSWLEPTAYAVLALRATGNIDSPRARDGFRVIWDRMIHGGGWNYVNTRVFANSLRPFPATTGIALTALFGEARDSRINESISYLATQLPQVRSPFSLSWALIGLTAQNARPSEADNLLAQCAQRCSQQRPSALEDALMLLADVPACPLVKVPDGDTNG